jgi:hypothetical protein
MQHANKGSVGGLENAPLWHVDALPVARRDPAPAPLCDAHFIDQVLANLFPIPFACDNFCALAHRSANNIEEAQEHNRYPTSVVLILIFAGP